MEESIYSNPCENVYNMNLSPLDADEYIYRSEGWRDEVCYACFVNCCLTGAVKQAQVTVRGNGLYDVEYTPDTEGPCQVDVSYAGHAVPNRYPPNNDFVVKTEPRIK